MKLPRLISFSFLVSALILAGAGCASAPPPETPPVVAPPEQAPPTEVPPTSTPPVPPASPTSTEAHEKNVTSTTMTNEPLAFPGVLPAAETTNKVAHIKTNKGDIVFEILPKEGPNAASNFIYLANHKFYDGLTFHRVEPNFVIQGGDPLGNGRGGPGYAFQDDPVHLPYTKGIVAMANAGPNTNGSQFFIMLGDTPLPPSYSIFGRVVSGQNVVDKIAVGDTMTLVTIEAKK